MVERRLGSEADDKPRRTGHDLGGRSSLVEISFSDHLATPILQFPTPSSKSAMKRSHLPFWLTDI
jgi:hypothetical protein